MALAQIYLSENQNEAAISELKTALSIDPNEPTALYQLSLARRKQGNMAEAKRLMQRFRTAKEKSHEDESELVQIIKTSDDFRHPSCSVRHFHFRRPSSEPAENWLSQAEASFERQNWNQSEAAAQAALRLNPKMAGALVILALIETNRSQLDRAEQHLRQAAALQPDEPSISAIWAPHTFVRSTTPKRLLHFKECFASMRTIQWQFTTLG